MEVNSAPAQMAVINGCNVYDCNIEIVSVVSKQFKVDLYGKTFHFLNCFSRLLTWAALLSVYSTTVYSDKIRAIRCTAIFYFIYAFSQVITVTLLGNGTVFVQGSMLTPATLLIYLIVGRNSLKLISDKNFYLLSTIFFWVAALVFFGKSVTNI